VSPKVAIVANPTAGAGSAVQLAMHAAQEFERAGWHCEVLATTAAGAGASIAHRAATSDGFDVVMAAGGDGTINEVLQGVVGTRAIFGAIPAGLANVWATEVGLSVRRGAFARLVTDGLLFDTDVGLVNGRCFLAMAGIGFDAAVVRDVRPAAKRRWGQLAYVSQALSIARSWPAVKACIDIDGSELSLSLFGLVATNVDRYAGVFHIAPAAKLDDGLLDLVLCRDGGRLGRYRSMATADARWRRWDRAASLCQARSITVRTDVPVAVHTDAELAGTSPCRIDVLPRSITVLLPRAAEHRYLSPGRALSRS